MRGRRGTLDNILCKRMSFQRCCQGAGLGDRDDTAQAAVPLDSLAAGGGHRLVGKGHVLRNLLPQIL